eukprot:750395-Lingulodinium_polyedra.AAC.1
MLANAVIWRHAGAVRYLARRGGESARAEVWTAARMLWILPVLIGRVLDGHATTAATRSRSAAR